MKTKFYIPNTEEQQAINHILTAMKNHDRLYTENGGFNEKAQADKAVANLLSSGFNNTRNPTPLPWKKQELKALYKTGYRLSRDSKDHTIEKSYQQDKLTMLESANKVFNLHDHKEKATAKELYQENWLTTLQYLKLKLKNFIHR